MFSSRCASNVSTAFSYSTHRHLPGREEFGHLRGRRRPRRFEGRALCRQKEVYVHALTCLEIRDLREGGKDCLCRGRSPRRLQAAISRLSGTSWVSRKPEEKETKTDKRCRRVP
ncbi:hypothetical protein TGME49_221865 [Toxoplasma gondii ME49]|uniref:Uncharacterized protein n=2 Tax=Toxoplasma gondii TaxID=5811 RepID=S8GTX1_TOXGM|nr:hypothetical protein TGME49_221865 [Toxoplasma gondii ME49]EPT32019.1 hypothetical protein TGME49_221865 [Toxoplasma gondii ME49]KYF42642.1 hypothetical protein TGARI_221865 [Toxoplasma gondii ARI]|eukprot:XP_018638288.1 hypothetical protein TGME49_221865 [Toxoplasma gondii ME49]